MKQRIINISYILLVVVIAACNVSKDNVKPTAELPAEFRNQSSVENVSVLSTPSTDSSENSGIANLSWRRFFNDPVLQKLIDTAIEKNFDMQLAIKNIETAQLLLKQSRWGYAPDVSLQVSASSNRPSDNSLNGLSAS